MKSGDVGHLEFTIIFVYYVTPLLQLDNACVK